MVNTEADRMPEATRTRGAFNAAIKEVCDAFEIEKSMKNIHKATDLFSDGKDVFISLHVMALPTVHF